ncbi:MAG: hypothetical protein WAP23_00325, partial [Candidatus Spechtbacterales bacterium]
HVVAKEENVGRYVVVEQATGKVVNVILLDPSSDWFPPQGHIVVPAGNASPGEDIWDGKKFKKAPKEEKKPESSSVKSDGNDVAELMASEDFSILPGDMVAVTDQGLTLRKTNKPYDRSIVGVVSTDPGIVLGRAENGRNVPVALTGRVSLKVSVENGPIVSGDAITSSSKPGVGMKATKPGRVVGIALEPYDTQADVAGKITILINPHWYGDYSNLGYSPSTPLGASQLTAQQGTDPNAPTPLTLESLATRVDSIEARVFALELKLDDAGSLATSPQPPPYEGEGAGGEVGFLASVKTAFETLGAKIQDGILEVKQLITRKLAIEQSKTETIDNTIGEGVILAGATSATIQAPAIGAYDKVFVSPDKPIAMGIIARAPGEGFTVGIAEPAIEDLYFDWWIVGVKIINDQANLDALISNATTTDLGVSATTTEPNATSTVDSAN